MGKFFNLSTICAQFVIFGILTTGNASNEMSEPDEEIFESSSSLEEPLDINTRILISTDVNTVEFTLWTPEGGFENPFVFNHKTPPQELTKNHFDPSRDTKIICHGFTSQITFSHRFVKAYLNNTEYSFNMIGVDWNELAAVQNYLMAAFNTVSVGKHIASVFYKLIVQGLGTDPFRFHFIGHSLGSHVGGHFGREMKKLSGKAIQRLTGLDPAAPVFDVSPMSMRIDKGDANLVDVIHTCSGSPKECGLSFEEPLGHVDFYPNGGHDQPGCDLMTCIFGYCFQNVLQKPLEVRCNHSRATLLYVASISFPQDFFGFLATRCFSYELFMEGFCDGNAKLEMGENINATAPFEGPFNMYYLKTTDMPPYTVSTGNQS